MSLLRQGTWRIIDHSTSGLYVRALQSFAIDDTLCASVGGGQSPAAARAWVHKKTVVMGIQDGRLPFLQKGIDFVQSRGYDCIVRNSGGLAVVLDENVLNLTLVFPEKSGRIGINNGYDAMWELIRHMFRDFEVEIEAGEIVGSYCPGSYDLSIDGKKFAGISQRRIRGGVAVQIYLDVCGDAAERAALIKGFYEQARGNEETKFIYPEVNTAVMASLSELLSANLTVEDVMERFLYSMKSFSSELMSEGLTEEEQPVYESYLVRIEERNEKLGLLG
ncbi:lipoate--protein ligase family protein [Pradoshia sp.]